jgi:DNA-binding TFAR19-related protein (PDSD5 family)
LLEEGAIMSKTRLESLCNQTKEIAQQVEIELQTLSQTHAIRKTASDPQDIINIERDFKDSTIHLIERLKRLEDYKGYLFDHLKTDEFKKYQLQNIP